MLFRSGIGTYLEDKFLRKQYNLDGTGWATPFLLCPEATNVDNPTLEKLIKATDNDIYVSNVSPLGVPFSNLRDSLSEIEKNMKVMHGRPGSPCPKGFLVSNTEFTNNPICTASRQYQKLKIDQLHILKLEESEYKRRFDSIIAKACICHDLGESALTQNNIKTKVPGFTAICPGPNIAYFSKVVSLQEMVDHIYGRINLITTPNRPHIFIKELGMYIDYLKNDILKSIESISDQKVKYFIEFKNNLLSGIEYYQKTFPEMVDETLEFRTKTLHDLENRRQDLLKIVVDYSLAFRTPVAISATV